MPRPKYARYQVALKLLLRRGNRVLFIKAADRNRWDLPGGRIDQGEEQVPLEKILAREVREELGAGVKYRLGIPLFQFRRPVPKLNTYNLITVYAARYLSGKIRLSFEHVAFQWLDPKKIPFPRGRFFQPRGIPDLPTLLRLEKIVVIAPSTLVQ